MNRTALAMSLSLPLLVALSACTRVSGTVDGESPDAVEAIFIQNDEAYGSDGSIQVWISDVPESCDAFAEFYNDLPEDWWDWLDTEEIVDAYERNLPEQHWLTKVTFRVDDVDDELGGLEFKGVDWDESLADDDEMKATTYFQERYPEEDELDVEGLLGGDQDWGETWYSDDGDGKITGHTPDESLRGNFAAEFVDSDGDDQGELSLSFAATRCRDLEDALDL
ncbi:MAG: hypothetical protein VX899_24050 [Myxococcota bacterium]|nr:hypothetical protein [Myxococcota bacterium]